MGTQYNKLALVFLSKDETKTTYDDFFTALDYLLYVLLFKKTPEHL